MVIPNNKENILYSSARLYEDFDFQLPLNISDIETEEIGNIIYTYAYFDGHTVEDGTSRVYCVCAHPAGQTNLPIIVFVNQINKGIDMVRLNNWANDGYMAVQVDLRGETVDCPAFTVYPPSISYANYNQAGRHMDYCDTNAKQDCWYEWTINVRRAITYISTFEMVDTKRIGIYSYRDASIIAIHIAATDDRIKAAAVMFGNCWHDVDVSCKLDLKCSDEEMDQKLLYQQERQRYLAGICPQSYLSLITKPFYVCMGTNSLTTKIDTVHDAIARINNNKQTSLYFLPKLMDIGQLTDRRNLTHWFNCVLKSDIAVSEAPILKINCVDGKLMANIDVNGIEYNKLEVFYSRSDTRSCVRNWVCASCEEDNNFRLNVYSDSGIIAAYATVTLKNNIKLSTNLVFVDLAQYKTIDKLRQTRVLYSGNESVGSFVPLVLTSQMTMETIDHNPVTGVSSLFAIKGVSGKEMATYAMTDNKYCYDINSILNLDVYSDKPQKLTITLVVNWSVTPSLYRQTVELLGGNIWQKVSLPIIEFKLENGKPLKENNIIEILHFHPEDSIVLNNIVFS